MSHPSSPVAQGFDILDLNSLARVTAKTFERLAPYTSLQNPSSLDARPAVIKILNKIKAYVEAIDTSIEVIHIIYQMSKIAASLWNSPPALSNEKQLLKERMEQQQRLEDLVLLADEAYQKAQKTNTLYKQVQQDFYRIAASTKNIDGTVEIAVDPALPKLLEKPIKNIGHDLVSNLNLLTDFTRLISDLTTWCGWAKSSIIAIDGSVVPRPNGPVVFEPNTTRLRWDRVRADCLIYQSKVSEIQNRYSVMLPMSTKVWRATILEMNAIAEAGRGVPSQNGSAKRLGLSRKVSMLLQDAVRHLSCHTQSCFAT